MARMRKKKTAICPHCGGDLSFSGHSEPKRVTSISGWVATLYTCQTCATIYAVGAGKYVIMGPPQE